MINISQSSAPAVNVLINTIFRHSKSNTTKKNSKPATAGEYLNQYTYTPEVLESLNRKEVEDRVKLVLHHLRKLGIPEEFLFKQEDLIELKHVPRVTRCIATLAKMVSLIRYKLFNIHFYKVFEAQKFFNEKYQIYLMQDFHLQYLFVSRFIYVVLLSWQSIHWRDM